MADWNTPRPVYNVPFIVFILAAPIMVAVGVIYLILCVIDDIIQSIRESAYERRT